MANNESIKNIKTSELSIIKDFKSALESFNLGSTIKKFTISGIKDAVAEIKDLDNILSKIEKTSDLTTQQLKKLGIESYDTASKYGKSAADYLTDVQKMYQAGFNNANQISELSILAQTVGDMTSDMADNYIIATNAAYNLKGNIKYLNDILDGQNYITNNSAVSMLDMAQATAKAAATAAQYGVNINELSGLIAVAIENTKETGIETGNALNNLFTNLQNTDNKSVTAALSSIGISMTEIKNGAEQLKTPIELLKELSNAFNSLSQDDIRRDTLLNNIGGESNANTLSAILSDWSSYENMLDIYSKGSGSAMQDAEKSADNLTGSLNKLSNTWDELVNHFVSSDELKGIVNISNDILSVIDNITSHIGLLATALAGLGISGGISFFKDFDWLLRANIRLAKVL